jgi:hypothetical protein
VREQAKEVLKEFRPRLIFFFSFFSILTLLFLAVGGVGVAYGWNANSTGNLQHTYTQRESLVVV